MNLSFFQRKRRTKIMLYVLAHPFCSSFDILKNSGATSNRLDLLHDIKSLLLGGCLKGISFNKRFFVRPLTPQYDQLLKMYQSLDRLAITLNQKLKTKSLKQLHEIKSSINYSNVGSILCKYQHGLDNTRPLDDQFFLKIGFIFVQKFKIFLLELKRSGEELNKIRLEWDDCYDEQIALLEKEKELLDQRKFVPSIDKQLIVMTQAKVRKERGLVKIDFKIKNEQWEKTQQRSNLSMNILYDFVDFFTFFVKNYDYLSKTLFSIPATVDRFSRELDEVFDNDQKYLKTFRSKRRKSLKERIKIWTEILTLGDIKKVIEKYHYKNAKPIMRIIKSIQDERGNPDCDKIMELQKIEKNRILVPNTSDGEITLLFLKYYLRNAYEKIPKGFQKEKAKQAIQEKFPGMISI